MRKAENFRDASKPNFDLYVISFICTNFEAFTKFSTVYTRICHTNLSIGQKRQKRQTVRNQFEVQMAIVFTKCISLFQDDQQFLYYVVKQCLSGLELIKAHGGILYCLPMSN